MASSTPPHHSIPSTIPQPVHQKNPLILLQKPRRSPHPHNHPRTPPHYSIPSTKPQPVHENNPPILLQKPSRSLHPHNHPRTSPRLPSLAPAPSPATAGSGYGPIIGTSAACASSTAANTIIPGPSGGGICSSPAPQTASCGILPPRPELGPEFRGTTSTRVLSKRNLNHPRYSNSNNNRRPPSSSAKDCLSQLVRLGSSDEKAVADLLLSFDRVLRGPEDYGFLIRELGEQTNCFFVNRCFQFALCRMRDPTEKGKLLIALITALGKKGRADLAKEAFDAGLVGGYGNTLYAYSALISAYARSGMSTHAIELFEWMKTVGMKPNTVAYNTVVDAVCKCGNMELAIQIMSEMQANNVQPNIVTYNTIMAGYSKLERYNEALELYKEVKALGVAMDRECFNTLLSIYVKMGRYEDVVKTSEEMERLGINRDVVTYTVLIEAYGKQGRFKVVGYLIESMRAERIVPYVSTYSTLIDVYSKAGMYRKALEIYMEFQETGLKANVVLYNSLIDTLCKNGRVESAVWLLNEMISIGIRPDVITYSSIINAFGRPAVSTEEDGISGDVNDEEHGSQVLEVFGQLVRSGRRTVTEDARISSQELFCILDLFRRMHSLGIKPNVVTFSSILNACSNCNSFEDASLLLEQLRSFDSHLYGVAHGLLMGSGEVWMQARALFDELQRMDSSTSAIVYNTLTDMLWHFGQRKGAQLVVFEGMRRNVWGTTWTDSCLDLHLMSSGAAQAIVHAWLLNMQSVVCEGRELPTILRILTGWGKHSKVSGMSILRHDVEALLAKLDAPFHVDRFNMGRFVSQGTLVAAWLNESCVLNSLILHDVRLQPDNGYR